MHTDNDTLKENVKSLNTLNTLYHEARQDIDHLTKQISQKDNLIADLNLRLGKYERIGINVEGYEPVAIGPSKDLLNSLCKEICRIEQKRKDTEVKASLQTEFHTKEIQNIQVALAEKERELSRVTHQPEHEKDQEIQRLRSALEDKERAQATRAVLCNSLEEEADQLQGQLRATMKVCRELLDMLGRDKTGEMVEEMPQQRTAEEKSESTNTSGVENRIYQLEEENQQLKQRVAYVEVLNSKWQRYDSSREEYVRKLRQQLLKESNNPAGDGGVSSVPRQGTAASSVLLHQEIARLNSQLDEKMRECGRLARDLEETRRQHRERIQTMEQQVLIYTEDFKFERADRERAHSRMLDLEQKLAQLQQRLRTQQGAGGESRDVVAPICRGHIGHRISQRKHINFPEPKQRTSSKPPTTKQKNTRSAALVIPTPVCTDVSELQCPSCFAMFDENCETECLNHLENCRRY
ncbi:TNFAIP3-interacting protein 2 [Aplochiton taeniatus]